MAQFYTEMPDFIKEFIVNQKMFFVGTAASDGRVNVSPKGMDSLRILGDNRLAWLNLTGSGNETAAHLLESNRITLMFCSFDEKPLILRLYGKATAVHPRDAQWDELYSLFPDTPGARQIFDTHIETSQTSCGFAVPIFEFKEERDTLRQWAGKKGEQGIQEYWEGRNQVSIDGKPTDIIMGEIAAT